MSVALGIKRDHSYQTKHNRTLSRKEGGKKIINQLSLGPLISMQMASTGICGTDDHVLKGDLSMKFPLIPGHEGAGIVESVGDGVCSVKPGRKWETTFFGSSTPGLRLHCQLVQQKNKLGLTL